MSEFKYNTRTFMKSVLNLEEKYIDDIFSYYKNSLINYVLQTEETNRSPYRKKLIQLYNNNILISEDGRKKIDKENLDKKKHI